MTSSPNPLAGQFVELFGRVHQPEIDMTSSPEPLAGQSGTVYRTIWPGPPVPPTTRRRLLFTCELSQLSQPERPERPERPWAGRRPPFVNCHKGSVGLGPPSICELSQRVGGGGSTHPVLPELPKLPVSKTFSHRPPSDSLVSEVISLYRNFLKSWQLWQLDPMEQKRGRFPSISSHSPSIFGNSLATLWQLWQLDPTEQKRRGGGSTEKRGGETLARFLLL